ncbi:hypothetical protein KKH36_03765 [Patescibacteria group bacterium]|nr:hypothetical protein [Patescibacteria group bacterium]
MKNRSLKIFIACAFGAGIGSMISLEINKAFWWLGIPAGGLVGYFSYEFKSVIQAFKKAWGEVTSFDSNFYKEVERVTWKAIALGSIGFAFTPVYLGLQSSLLFNENSFNKHPILMILFVLSYNLFIIPCVFKAIDRGKKKMNKDDWKEIFFKVTNPLLIFFYWPFVSFKCIFKALWWILFEIPVAVVMTASIIKKTFILIHSDIRLICGLDAAIGTAIGYYTGFVLVGMIVGGIIGVINYKLVSRKILKLKI